MIKKKIPCTKCGDTYIDVCGFKRKNINGYCYGSMWGREIILDKTIDEEGIKYAKEITGRKLCDYCFGTGEVDFPVLEPITIKRDSEEME